MVSLDGRIFLVDREVLTQNEVTETILYPTHRNRVSRLSGLVLGVSSRDDRRIAGSRVLLDRSRRPSSRDINESELPDRLSQTLKPSPKVRARHHQDSPSQPKGEQERGPRRQPTTMRTVDRRETIKVTPLA